MLDHDARHRTYPPRHVGDLLGEGEDVVDQPGVCLARVSSVSYETDRGWIVKVPI